MMTPWLGHVMLDTAGELKLLKALLGMRGEEAKVRVRSSQECQVREQPGNYEN